MSMLEVGKVYRLGKNKNSCYKVADIDPVNVAFVGITDNKRHVVGINHANDMISGGYAVEVTKQEYK